MLSFVPFSHQNGGDSTPATNETYQPIIDKLRSVGDYFTENAGQVANGQVRFYSSGDMQVGFADSAVLLRLVEREESRPLEPFEEHMRGRQVLRDFTSSGRGVMFRITFEGSNRVTPGGVEEMPNRNNYFIGNDPAKWRTGVRNYREVLYRDIYDGIDLSYMMQGGRLKYEFLVGPGVDPRLITVSYEGVESVRLSETGELAINTALGEMKDGKPIAYQDGKMLECTFVMREPLSFGFECDRHDPSRPLVIDPFIYSTFLGGSQQEWFNAEMKIDATGNAYVAGLTRSPDFPVTPGAFDTKFEKAQAFVTKLKADGSSLVYSTFVGEIHNAVGLALDSTGSAYICGEGPGPLTPGAYNNGGGHGDAYVARLSPQGDSLIFGARIGGDDHDNAIDVGIDDAGNVYLFGNAYSRDFPTTPGAYDRTHNGGTYDLFVAKFNPSASTLLFSTYIGGKKFEYGTDMAIDAAGYPYVTGWTGSSDFPTTPGAYDRSFTYYDSYVVKVNVTGSSLMYSTFLNGVEAYGVATDADGYAYVTGRVDEPTFPTTPGAYDTTANGRLDAFVTKFNPHGSGLVYSTRLGASDSDVAISVVVNSQGHAVLTGGTYSVGFPTTPGALRTCPGGSLEVFVTEFDSEAKSLVYSTYFGGSKRDVGDSIQVDSSGAYIVAGTTVSPDYPVTPGAFDTTYNGGDEYYGDFFVTKLNQTPAPNTAPMILNFETSPAKEGSPLNFTVNACDAEGDPLTYSFDFESDGTIDVTSPDKDVYHIWGDDYEGTATVSVSDGNLSTTATSSYTIENVPPLVAVIPPPIGDEGDTFPFLVRVTDPGSDDITIEWSASCTGLSSSTVYPNNPSSFPDPYPSPEFNPRDITEGQNVTCGDDGVLSWGVRVTDDDGGTTEKDGTFTVKNLPPTLSVQPPSLTQIDEGVLMTLMATATDPGSDDIVFMWYGECSGWSSPVSYPNDPSAFPDPDPSPEIDPRNVTDTQNVVCGDDGLYSWRLVVEDDDGGSVSAHGDISTSNVAPSAVIGGEMTIHEGEMVRLIATAADQGSDDLTFSWSWGEGFSESRTYFNDGLGPDSPRSPNGTFPFTAVDETAHVYGDNGIYTITLTVIDDDGDSTVLRTELTVLNLPPEIMLLAIPTSVNENEEFTLVAEATDQGSDDIEFSWTFEVGPSMSTMFYNDGVGPDPPMSPWGTFPFTAEDPATYTYGDNGHYNVTIIAADDDGGISTMTFTIDVKNLAPSVDIGGPYWGVENSPIDFTAIASDPGSDDLTFIWDWGDGTTDDAVFYNNGLGPDPPKSPWGEYPFNVNHAISHIWGDNGDFTVTLTVMDDDGGTTVQETVLSIENVAPTIESIRYYLNASFTFRIAGEKWHNVEIFLYEEGTEIGYADITRYPGSPNEQMVTLADISIDFSKTYSAVAYYTPEDDPVNGQIWGATPAWVILDYEDGEERIHHTFNVRHEDTWTWVIDDFSAYFLGHNITFMATASDPGSDDLTFSWDWGDGNTTENTYFNDGVGPDPYPSPEVNPITVTDTVKHAHASAGPYTVTLTVTDDDGGITSYSLNLAL